MRFVAELSLLEFSDQTFLDLCLRRVQFFEPLCDVVRLEKAVVVEMLCKSARLGSFLGLPPRIARAPVKLSSILIIIAPEVLGKVRITALTVLSTGRLRHTI
jgi:hypothetical protein